MLKYDNDGKIARNDLIDALEKSKWIKIQLNMWNYFLLHCWESLSRFNLLDNETEALRLIEAGEDGNETDSSGYTGMHLAALYGNVFKEKEQLRKKYLWFSINEINKFCPGYDEVIKLLIEKGYGYLVHTAYCCGVTPLHLAAIQSNRWWKWESRTDQNHQIF